MNDKILDKILLLMDQHIHKKISSKLFKSRYFVIWRKVRDDNIIFPDNIQQVLDKIFSDCDLYEEDKILRGKYSISESKLLEYTNENFKILKKIK